MTVKLIKSFKILIASISLLLLVLAIIPLFISLDQFRPQIAEQLSVALGRDAQLGKLQLRLLPFPKLQVSELLVGSPDQMDVQVMRADIYPALLPLLDDMLVVKHIHLEGLSITQEFIEYVTSLSNIENSNALDSNEDSFSFHLEKITASQISLQLSEGVKLGPYKLEVTLNKDSELNFAWLARMDDAMRLDLTLKESIYKIYIQAKDWQMPVQPAWKFTSLAAVGELINDSFNITAINAQLYGGSILGTSQITWNDKWRVWGKADVNAVQLKPFLKPLLDEPVVAGALTGKANYDLNASQPSDLGDTPMVDADITINDGIIYNADLEQATNLIGETKPGGETPFSILSGKLKMQQGSIKIKKLQLKSDTLEADGYIKISHDNKLAGVIEVGVSKTGSLVSVPIKISGTVDSPDLRPTNEAMAGGSIGTAILGPGVGTALGIKVGTFISNLFGSDEDSKDDTPKEPVTFSEGDEEE